MAEINFKGFKQASLVEYNQAKVDGVAKGYLWLVRDLDEEKKCKHSQIYFGTRLYAEINSDSEENEKIQNIINSLGEMVSGGTGAWEGWLEEDHEIIGGLSDLTQVIEALESYLLQEKADREEAISAETIAREEKDAELETRIEDLEKEITSAHTKDIEELKEKINILSGDLETEVETRIEEDQLLADAIQENAEAISANTVHIDEVEEKVNKLQDLGVLHFVGVASAVSDDNKTIILHDGTEIEASTANTGDVYIIDHKEYASNGSEWVELGDESELVKIASALTVEVEERKEADSNLQKEIDSLQDKLDAMDTLHIVTGDDVEGYEDEEELEVATAGELKSVATYGGTLELQSNATNNTIIKLGE